MWLKLHIFQHSLWLKLHIFQTWKKGSWVGWQQIIWFIWIFFVQLIHGTSKDHAFLYYFPCSLRMKSNHDIRVSLRSNPNLDWIFFKLASTSPDPNETEAKLLWPCLVPKNFQDFLSHQILRHIHGALNIKKIKTNCTVYL